MVGKAFTIARAGAVALAAAASAVTAAALVGGAARAQEPGSILIPSTPVVGVQTDASAWRMIDGEGVSGVMGLGPFLRLGEPDAVIDVGVGAPPRVGYFALHVEGRGVFEGVYNLKEGGSAVVGAFWPDGGSQNDVVSGFIDIRSVDAPEGYGGAGVVTFIDDGAEFAISAR